MHTSCNRPGNRSTVGKTWMFAGLLTVISTMACASASTLLAPRRGAESYQAGVEAYRRGNYEHAIADLTNALEVNSDFGQAYYARGEVFYLLGQYEQAIADYSRAIEAEYQPTAQAYSALGDAYFAIGDSAPGEEAYAEAYALNDEFVRDYYPDRRTAHSRAIELNPEFASAYYARGWSNFLLGEDQHAIADFSTAIQLHHEPVSPAYLWSGWANYHLEDNQQAAADFTAAIENAPASAEAHDGRGHAYIRLASYELALADFARAVELAPDSGRVHNNRCWFGSLLGRVKEVMESCERAVALGPDIPAYRDSRAVARAVSGDYSGAIEDFRLVVEVFKSMGDEKRAFWLRELEAGRDPFDEATLRALLDE